MNRENKGMAAAGTEQIIQETEKYVLHTYNRYPIALKSGTGVTLTDEDGKDYLDFGAGIAVFALGYGNEAYNQALKDQIDRVIHTSNLFYHKPLMKLRRSWPQPPACPAAKCSLPTAGQRRLKGPSKRPGNTPGSKTRRMITRLSPWTSRSTDGASARFP